MVDYIGKQLGNYQLSRLIGEGAFAQVYLGEHIYLGTQAAIKVLNTQAADYPMDWFRTEARTIARLVHPNIVRVLEFGVVDTTPFLVLDYAPDGSIRQHYPLGLALPLPTVVSYTKQAAEALQYVHDEKLIHRDVKPENLLLGRRDEVLLSDFGIALMMQTFHSGSIQEVSGTLPYMAPEQIQGKPVAASDQYALGVIVYEWLTGKRPFDGSMAEIISQHLAAPPPPLSGRIKLPSITPAIEQVVMTALEKDPEKRFGSVRAFALALELASQLSASSPGPIIAPASEGNAKGIANPPSNPSYGASAQDKQINVPQPSRAAPMRPSVPQLSVYNVQANQVGTVISSYRGHQRAIRSLCWSPMSVQIVSASDEKLVHVWDAMTGNKLRIYQDTSDAVPLAAWSFDGSLMATIGADALVRVWDFSTGRLLVTYLGHAGSMITALAWSPQQHFLASAANDGTIHVWDATKGNTLCIYRGHMGSVNMLAWSPDGPSSSTQRGYSVVSGGDDGVVRTWDAMTGNNLALYYSQPTKIASVAWSSSVYPAPPPPGVNPSSNRYFSSRVACGREDGMVEMWDTTLEREVLSYRYPAPISVVAWSPDGTRFAYASDNSMIEVWDTRTNLKLFTFTHPAPLSAMAWSPDGRYIACGGEDATIQVWVAPRVTPQG